MDKIDELVLATDSCTEQLSKMIPMEQEKQKALISGNMQMMEKMVSDQQAVIMQLENLENHRLLVQKEAGFSGMNATQVLQQAQPGARSRLEKSFQSLRETAQKLKLYNEEANKFAKATLQFLQGTSGKRSQAAQRTTYHTDGTQDSGWNSGSSLKIKI
ncbi:MAG: flagellar protein FlgN [Oscillospiraceae bacterium]|jgi:hypothetical protein|nr:flagellar protein FlgN [Oscillospiraceae bacterium]